MTDGECVELLQWAAPRLGLRYRGFVRVRGQVCKRLTRRVRELGLSDAAAYRRRLEEDPSEWATFDALCRVTISRFYRDRRVWDVLGADLLPPLARAARDRGEPLRCWSAGCASGEEPYTLSLVLRYRVASELPGLSWRILATDADEKLLERARRGCYRRGTLRELPEVWRRSAFEEQEGQLCLREEHREGVVLQVGDIRGPVPAGPWDLLLCRNLVLTYLDAQIQRRVFAELLREVRPGGIVVVGAHEIVPDGFEAELGLERVGSMPVFRYLPPHVHEEDRLGP